MGRSQFFTKTYSDGDALVLSETEPFSQATLTVLSGTCTVQGNYPMGATPSAAITLTSGRTLTLSSRGPGSPLDGITITPSTPGSVGVLLQP